MRRYDERASGSSLEAAFMPLAKRKFTIGLMVTALRQEIV
jgi:hypothetical protein